MFQGYEEIHENCECAARFIYIFIYNDDIKKYWSDRFKNKLSIIYQNL